MIDLDVPWWTYESFNFLKDYLNDKTKLEAFEYGPGASSFWLKKYCKRIDFVEYDKTFYKHESLVFSCMILSSERLLSKCELGLCISKSYTYLTAT